MGGPSEREYREKLEKVKEKLSKNTNRRSHRTRMTLRLVNIDALACAMLSDFQSLQNSSITTIAGAGK